VTLALPGHTKGLLERGLFRCPLCLSRNFEALATSLRCIACDHSYLVEQGIPILVRNPGQLENALESARERLPDWYLREQPTEEISPWRHHLRRRREYVEALIDQHLGTCGGTPVETLLDLGCGDGNHLQYLHRFARLVCGSDYNLQRLQRARHRFPHLTLFLADILDYPVHEGVFDIIFFNHVLEHIAEDTEALQTVFRILKRNGLLILGVPNEGAWWWKLALKLQPAAKANTDHVHFYTAKTVCQQLGAAGFTVLEIKHLGWGPPHYGLDQRLRRFKFLDACFEGVGRTLLPRQATSLYIRATKG
jgi:SAM-dependent methyltransferase